MSFDTQLTRVHDLIDANFPEHLSRTREFLRIPGISAEKVGLVESAQWLGKRIAELGGRVELCGGDAPIVLGLFDLGKPKTLLVYGMYDVHPVANQSWSSPPFAADIKVLPEVGPCVVARGACNSKGPLMGFLNAVDALRNEGDLPVNLILTIEGEEEIGSPTLPSFYKENERRLKADAGFEPFWAQYGTDVDKPILALGAKGILVLEVICRGGEWGGPIYRPIHSSVGAWLASPTWRLIKALNTLVGEDEVILIDGFYQEVVSPTPEEERLLSALGETFDEKSTLDLMGARRFKYPLGGTDLLRKYLYSPSINIGALPQTDTDEIPCEARAQIAIRLVPQMSVDRTVTTVRKHLDKHGYSDIEIATKASYPWSKTRFSDEVVQSMLETYRYHGVEPRIWPILASATPYYLFSQILQIPYTWGGLGRAGGSHSVDEFAEVDGLKLFEKSIATFLYKFAGADAYNK